MHRSSTFVLAFSSGCLLGLLVSAPFRMLAHFLLFGSIKDQSISSIAHNFGLLRPLLLLGPVVLVATATTTTLTTTVITLVLTVRDRLLRLLDFDWYFKVRSWDHRSTRVTKVSSAPVTEATIITAVSWSSRARVASLGLLIDCLDFVFGRSSLVGAHLLVVLLVQMVEFAGSRTICTTHLGAHHLRESTTSAGHLEGALRFPGLFLGSSLHHA